MKREHTYSEGRVRATAPRMAPPPLTCAGRVLKAASLPERRQGLALGTRRGPGGHAAGHVARISSARTDRRRAERVFGGRTVMRRRRRRKRGREEEGRGKMQDRCWELRGGGLLQSACVRACVRLRARYAPMSRDFQTSVELRSIPLQRHEAPPTLVPGLRRGQGRRVFTRAILLLP